MKSSLFLVFLVLPFLVNCFYEDFGPYQINERAIVYRAVYMYNTKDAPRVNRDGKSELGITVTATTTSKEKITGDVIVAFMPEEVFRNMGYRNDTGFVIPCCDEWGFKNNRCKEKNTLIIPEKYAANVTMKTASLAESPSVNEVYNVDKTGMYYIVAAVCNPMITPKTSLSGKMEVENPYGHLPGTQYSSLPFYSWMSFIYVLTLIVWGMLCIQYSKEIMSVHLMILAVLICFVVDYLVKVIYLWVYNFTGYDSLSYLSVFCDVSVRTLTRVLTILVCMGLGISCASIPESTLKLGVFAATYFLINCWDSYVSLNPPVGDLSNKIRIYITAGMDAMVYFWVFQSLMNTMEELKQNQQNAKLAVFTRLYTLLLVSVVVSTLTLVVFSYFVSHEESGTMWKYQWLMNDGIWAVYYYILFMCLMVMWKPNENASAYAYHNELATDIREDDEEYGLPQNKLVESEDEGNVVVKTINDDMKPMNITEGENQA